MKFLSALVTWFTAYSLRWTKLAFGAALLAIFVIISQKIIPTAVPPEALWLVIGVIVGAFANAMTAPDPSKSEVLTLAEKVLDNNKT